MLSVTNPVFVAPCSLFKVSKEAKLNLLSASINVFGDPQLSKLELQLHLGNAHFTDSIKIQPHLQLSSFLWPVPKAN